MDGDQPGAKTAPAVVGYPNAATDADAFVRVNPLGIEQFVQLRSADSPETFEYEMTLPDGAELRMVPRDGAPLGALPTAAEVRRGDERLALIPPAKTFDEDGEPVPTRMSVDGDRLTISVDHRSGDFAYPLLADPVVDFYGNGPFFSGYDFGGWGIQSNRPAGEFIIGYNGSLYVIAYGNGDYAPNSWGQWVLPSRANAYILRADFANMIHAPGNTQAYAGIYSQARNNWEPGFWLVFPRSGGHVAVRQL